MMRHRADTPIYKPQVSESPMPACAGTVIRHLFISRAHLIPDLPSCSLIPLSCSPALSPVPLFSHLFPVLTFSQLAPLISHLSPCSLTCSSSFILRPLILSHPAPRPAPPILPSSHPAPPILPHFHILHILRHLTSLFFLRFVLFAQPLLFAHPFLSHDRWQESAQSKLESM